MTKYSSRPTEVNGIRFDSAKEARRWQELLLLQRSGEIRDLARQFIVPLIGQNGPLVSKTGRAMKYVADFRYFDNRLNAWVIEDAKGFETDAFKLKRAICAAMGLDIKTV